MPYTPLKIDIFFSDDTIDIFIKNMSPKILLPVHYLLSNLE